MKKVTLVIIMILIGFSGYSKNTTDNISTKNVVSTKIPYSIYKKNPKLIENEKFKSKLIYSIPTKKSIVLT